MISCIFFLGLLLNSIILKFFWKDKSVTSTYFKAFAIFDLFTLTSLAIYEVFVVLFKCNNIVVYFLLYVLNLVVALYNFCPLFLALDRCLVVAFPHKFHKHEGKMRVAKGSMILFMLLLSLTTSSFERFIPEYSSILWNFVSLAMIVQVLTCLVLYAVIVVKVVASDREMKKRRHSGNTQKLS